MTLRGAIPATMSVVFTVLQQEDKQHDIIKSFMDFQR